MRASHAILERRYLQYIQYVLASFWSSPKAFDSNINAASGMDLVKGIRC